MVNLPFLSMAQVVVVLPVPCLLEIHHFPTPRSMLGIWTWWYPKRVQRNLIYYASSFGFVKWNFCSGDKCEHDTNVREFFIGRKSKVKLFWEEKLWVYSCLLLAFNDFFAHQVVWYFPVTTTSWQRLIEMYRSHGEGRWLESSHGCFPKMDGENKGKPYQNGWFGG